MQASNETSVQSAVINPSPEDLKLIKLAKSKITELQRILDMPLSGPREQSYMQVCAARTLLTEIQAIEKATSWVEISNAEDLDEAILSGECAFQPLFAVEAVGSLLVALIDTETTGLDEADEPISVAALLLEIDLAQGDQLREVDSYYGTREPTVPIQPKAQAIHGMSIDDVRGSAFDLRTLMKLVNSADILVAHNAKFDRRMLAKIIPAIQNANWACSIHTLSYEWAKISGGKRALDEICAALHIERPLPHNAMTDCRTLQAVLLKRAGKTERSKRLMRKLLERPWAPPP